MKQVRAIPEPQLKDPEVQEYLEELRAVIVDMDNGDKRRFVCIQELEEAGIARLVDGKLVAM